MFKSVQKLLTLSGVRSLSTSRIISKAYTADAQEGTFDLSRKFEEHEVYQPRDLNEQNFSRYKEQQSHKPKKDLFQLNNANPMKEYKNTDLLSYYVTGLGKIMPIKQTGLSRVNQRKLSRAIKRARAMGFIPYTYKIDNIY
ncbi:ribosomal protein S18 [Neoconidiobolus thromboides FSU 785]|nr:ribosomal protein S18 [Neoconidiobolus thromboides FSU 785]